MRSVIIYHKDLVDKGLVKLEEREYTSSNTPTLMDEHGFCFGVEIEEYSDEEWEKLQNASRTQ